VRDAVLASELVMASWAQPLTSRARWPGGSRLRAIRDGLSVAGLMLTGYLLIVVAPVVGTFGFDAFAYWAVDPRAPYPADIPLGNLGYFAYSPAFAQFVGLFGGLPWWVFSFLLTALLFGTLVWLGGRWALAWLCFVPVVIELYHGNIHLLLAAAIVLGFRHSWTWAFVLLTKVTPGVGLAWFAVRREWRPLTVALGATAAIVAVSWLLDPAAWSEWWAMLMRGTSGTTDCGAHCLAIPLLPRLIMALAIVIAGARTSRRWTVPLAAMLALPVLWLAGLSMMVAVVALAARDRVSAPTTTGAPNVDGPTSTTFASDPGTPRTAPAPT
jgi:hypothetical protein